MKSLQPHEMAALAGNLVCAESVMALRDVLDALGVSNRDCRQEGARIDASNRANYLFNTTIEGIEEADICLLIGVNPRKEAAMLNARLRKAWLNGMKIYNLGVPAELTYEYEHLGNNPRQLMDMVAGKHPMADVLSAAKRPMIILGSAAVARTDGVEIMVAARALADRTGVIKREWNGFNLLNHAAGRVGALDLGFVPGREGRDIEKIFDGCGNGAIKLVYLLGADEYDMNLLGKAFVIYQGHHGDDGAHRADVVLPGAAYTEKDATYVNLEGRVQQTRRAVFPPGQAKEDWAIIRALADVLKIKLGYSSLEQLRARMAEVAPHMAKVGEIVPASWPSAAPVRSFHISDMPFDELFMNFYMTDPISRASKTMAECTREIAKQQMKKAA